MITGLYGLGCDCDRPALLGDDSIDLSTIDFGGDSSPAPIMDLAPSSFPSLDTSTILDTAGGPSLPAIDPTVDAAAFGPLPTALPSSDAVVADESLVPPPPPAPPASVPASSAVTDILAAGAAASPIAAAFAKMFGTKPPLPPGYTYNAQGQPVPMPMVAGVPTQGSLASIGNLFTGSTLIPGVPNWLLIGGGVAAFALLGGVLEKGRRRNPESGSSHDVARRHQIRIAKQTLRMHPAMLGVMGGMTKDQARKILRESRRRRNGLADSIRHGDRVTIVNRFGQTRTGKAVMRSSSGGWVLNMGGAHGTPGLASDENIVRVRKAK